MSSDPHAVDPKAYNNLVSRAVLRSIRLTDSRFELKPEALEVDSDQWRKDINAEVREIVSSADAELLAGSFAFDVVCRHRRKKVVAVQAVYLVSFRLQGEYDQDAAVLFLERVGRVAAYPYFRSLVADLASQAGVSMPPLPIISLAPRTVSSAKDMVENYPVKALHEKGARPRKRLKAISDKT